MIFSIAIILIVLGVTYIHYLQGAFTSAISLACAVAATLVAFGYYENVINTMNQSGFADFAGGMVLVVLFAVTYLVLRVLADMIVPGNIALQLYVEKTVAVVCGFLAAMLGGGTYAVAVQMMPMGAAVAGHSQYELREREVQVPAALVGRQRGSDSFVFDEVVNEKMDAPPASLLLPADSFVLGLVKTASGGSFAGSQSFGAIHPDLLTEAFNNRIGGEHSHKRVVFNNAKKANATLDGLFVLNSTPTFLDTDIVEIRPSKQNLTYKLGANDRLVVVRVGFSDIVVDKDGFVRFTPSSARLVIDGTTYHPIGTMENAGLVGIHRLDDMIIVPVQGGSKAADLVYAFPKNVADSLSKPATDPSTVRFFEVKLFGRIDLSDKKTENYVASPSTVRVLRKPPSPLGKVGRPAATP